MRISREAPLLLASASPRRRELLELAQIPFEVVQQTPTSRSVTVRRRSHTRHASHAPRPRPRS